MAFLQKPFWAFIYSSNKYLPTAYSLVGTKYRTRHWGGYKGKMQELTTRSQLGNEIKTSFIHSANCLPACWARSSWPHVQVTIAQGRKVACYVARLDQKVLLERTRKRDYYTRLFLDNYSFIPLLPEEGFFHREDKLALPPALLLPFRRATLFSSCNNIFL